jgi:hypothetical protein
LYHRCFQKNEPKKFKKDQYQNPDYLYPLFLDHINAIEKITHITFEEKHFIAAKNVKTISELLPFLKYLYDTISLLSIRRPQSELSNESVLRANDTIEAGRIFWDKLDLPEAFLYHIMKREPLKFSQSIAAILTFWNLQMNRLKSGSR